MTRLIGNELYLSSQEAAAVLGVSYKTVHRWEDDGVIGDGKTAFDVHVWRTKPVAGHRFFKASDVHRLLDGFKVMPPLSKRGNRTVNLTAKRFGDLLVLGLLPLRVTKRHAMWLCLCDCGKASTARGSHLTSGQVTSCRVRHKQPVAERFWPKVLKGDGCWIWTATRSEDQYGRIDCQAAHRVSWQIHFGPIPDSLQVLHKCDNPPCVRPDHLFLGTQADNMRDMATKNRGFKKVSDEQVREIRSRYVPYRMSYPKLARIYGLHPGTVASICKGERRRYVH